MRKDLRQYWRLGKFRVYQHAYGGLLGLTALGLDNPRNWIVCLASVLSFQFMVSGGCALDDLTGSRNGSDYQNYVGASEKFARNVAMKPLLTGQLTERQVQGWAVFSMTAAGIIGGIGLVFASGEGRKIAIALFVACLILTPQYSWGLRASYWPTGGELLLAVTHALCVIWPAIAVTGTVSPIIGAEAILFATGFLLISLCSNQNDHVGDREVGRKTIAVMFGIAGTSAGLATVLLVQIGVIVVLIVSGLSCWLLIATGPGLAVGFIQSWAAIYDRRWMYARALGIKGINLMFVGLVVFNLFG